MDENSKLFEQLPKGSISEIIIQRITDALINGELKPGDKIPTEAEFSQKLGICRNSVREAVKVLCAFGVLEIKRSEGTFVVEKFNQTLFNPIVYGIILSNKSFQDLLEFKLTSLNSVLYLAIKKANNEDISKLKEIYNTFEAVMQESPPNIQKMYKSSKDFYSFLAQITKNPLIIQNNEVVMKISKWSRMEAIQVTVNTDRREYMPDYYLKIVELIETRDTKGIGSLIDYIFDRWKELLDK
ncbi:GntR family transcriptional regulator [Clostridium sp.]|uniref:FadR/GntR family transcriptional regulator n=1 Tax=Clostridium sp. TaxID=1506 RepID=UPI001A453F52|nr:GntR family transcriptional regulator [Clostridium sp.]MBK5242293.1 FadR family transcriptional regulator [Clostridium sp.]